MCEFCLIRDQEDKDDLSRPDAALAREETGPVRPYRSRNYQGRFAKTPDRLLGMGLIRFYQLTLSGFIGNSCRHLPTCSEYGYEAIARHGLWAGGWMTLFRVGRCGPGGTSGLDPVPDVLDADSRWWAPWRHWQSGFKRAKGRG